VLTNLPEFWNRWYYTSELVTKMYYPTLSLFHRRSISNLHRHYIILVHLVSISQGFLTSSYFYRLTGFRSNSGFYFLSIYLYSWLTWFQTHWIFRIFLLTHLVLTPLAIVFYSNFSDSSAFSPTKAVCYSNNYGTWFYPTKAVFYFNIPLLSWS